MEDDHVEQRLSAYRPSGPSPELRESALRAVRSVRLQPDRDRGLRWQLAAAAALLLAALLLHSATERIDRRIAVASASARDFDEQALAELTHELGDDANARLMAQVILLRERRVTQAIPDAEVPQ